MLVIIGFVLPLLLLDPFEELVLLGLELYHVGFLLLEFVGELEDGALQSGALEGVLGRDCEDARELVLVDVHQLLFLAAEGFV